MLVVATREFGHPVLLIILMKADNAALHGFLLVAIALGLLVPSGLRCDALLFGVRVLCLVVTPVPARHISRSYGHAACCAEPVVPL